jgi:hypothetical protein
MSSAATNAIPLNEPVSVEEQKEALHSSNGAPPEVSNEAAQAAMKIQQKYVEERAKRIREEGSAQYIDLSVSEKFKHFREDPWLDERSETMVLQDGDRSKYLILGGGLGGVLFGCKLVKAGIKPEDIRLVEVGGGFGGTW